MATIYNSDVNKELVEAGKLQQASDKIPNLLAEKIVPVMECNPKLLRISRVLGRTLSTGVATTILTTSAIKKTFVTAIQLNYTKDAANLSTQIDVRGYIDGEIVRLAELPCLASTAQTDHLTISFPFPILLDKNSVVNINQEATAVIRSSGIIYGYEVEP